MGAGWFGHLDGMAYGEFRFQRGRQRLRHAGGYELRVDLHENRATGFAIVALVRRPNLGRAYSKK